MTHTKQVCRLGSGLAAGPGHPTPAEHDHGPERHMGILWPLRWVTLVQSDSDPACDTPHAYQVIMETRVTLPWSH